MYACHAPPMLFSCMAPSEFHKNVDLELPGGIHHMLHPLALASSGLKCVIRTSLCYSKALESSDSTEVKTHVQTRITDKWPPKWLS